MENKEIEQGNKLIAEFMELEKHKEKDAYIINSDICQGMIGYFIPEQMYFHKSWDWLVPVIEKISNLTYEKKLDSGHWYNKFLYDTDQMYGSMYCEGDFISHFAKQSDVSVTKKVLWNRCVEFIKWYNKNK